MASEWVSPIPRCYESHKGLAVGGHTVYGGSASDPVVLDADIYVSLQRGSTSGRTSDPWDAAGQVVEVHFTLPDGAAPRTVVEVARFKKMIGWLCTQLQEGKKIHVGCIGGHGRTGMTLAALVSQATGGVDAISYVRKNYCRKAVESMEQVRFLHDHFGVKTVAPSHGIPQASSSGFRSYQGGHQGGNQKAFGFLARMEEQERASAEEFPVVQRDPLDKPKKAPAGGRSLGSVGAALHPVNVARSIWRRKKP